MTALSPTTSPRRDAVAGARASAWAPRAYFLGQLQLLIGLVRNAALLVGLFTLVLVATGVAQGMTAVAWALVGLAATAAVVSLIYNPWLRIRLGVPDDAESYYAATTTAYQTLYSEGFHFGWQTDADWEQNGYDHFAACNQVNLDVLRWGLRSHPRGGAAMLHMDVGCGNGKLCREAVLGFPMLRSIGVTIVDAHVDLARTLSAKSLDDTALSRLQFLRADMNCGIPAEDASLDLVTQVESFGYCHELRAHLTEIARVLAPGGRVVIEDHMWNRPRADATADSRGRKLARRVEEGWRFTIWEADRVRAIAADLGLRLIDDIDCDPGRVERTIEVQGFMTWWNTYVGAVYLPWAWCAGALVALVTGHRDRARRLGPRSFCINWQTSDAMLAAFALHRSKDMSNHCLVFEKR